ncbi:MAG: GNAT family N-acetyltransferase [Candidatus Hydrogenedens sp.]|nr:GNAT family N-acetyltransferase [Candidatus Hydrogenedens sp.]
MNIQFRPAAPEDADALTPLVYASGPDTFNYVFTAPRRRVDAQRFLRGTLRQQPGEFGYGVHTVGVADGRVVAGGTGFDAPMLANAMVVNLRQIVSAFGIAASVGVIRRGLAVEHLMPPPKGDQWYIAHLGVLPEMRSHGFGAQLVQELLAQGRARGRKVATLDCSLENPRAQALYERLGFSVISEVKANLRNAHGHVPGFRRMALGL